MTSSCSIVCLRPLIVLALAILLSNAPAHACREDRLPEQRISRIYQLKLVKAVILVRVDKVTSGEQAKDAHLWRASANARRVLQGEFPGGPIVLDGGLGSSLCDLGYRVPKPGDEWIAYLGFDDAGVLHAFPAPIARKADPQLR